MNKGIIFALGALTGAAAGAVATYFLINDRFAREAEEVIDDYAKKCSDKIDEVIEYYESRGSEDLDETPEQEVDMRDDISNNEGVKKYHHYSGGAFESGSDVGKLFAKEDNKVTEGQKDILEKPELEDVQGVDEITEDEFLEGSEEYSPITLDYFFNTDTLLFGYGTDNEDIAETVYNKTRSELIGNIWRWAPDYIKDDSGVGSAYVRNSNLMKDFEILIHYDPNEDVVEVG